MAKPLLLDLCCGAGGAAMGYHRAGFDVLGIDIADQPDYPFEFLRTDAIRFVREHGGDFDAIHASWPCQAKHPLTEGTNKGRTYPQLIPEGREAMALSGKPTIIENTAGNPIRKDLKLVGDMFRTPEGLHRLKVWRPRWFELTGFHVPQPDMPKKRGRTRGWRHGQYHDGPYLAVYGEGGGKGSVPEWQDAMGIDWTDVRVSIAEAIPPAYTEYIGAWLYRHVTGSERHEPEPQLTA